MHTDKTEVNRLSQYIIGTLKVFNALNNVRTVQCPRTLKPLRYICVYLRASVVKIPYLLCHAGRANRAIIGLSAPGQTGPSTRRSQQRQRARENLDWKFGQTASP
jgi:hypothetical protein